MAEEGQKFNGLKLVDGGPEPGAAIFDQADKIADELAELRDQVALASKARNTRRAYRFDWKHFTAWCEQAGLQALPASVNTVEEYLLSHTYALSPATLSRRLLTIAMMHREADQLTPTAYPLVKKTMKGIRSIRAELGIEQRKMAPLFPEHLLDIVAMLPRRESGELATKAKRDRLLLLVGFGAALRRSELAAINLPDITVAPEGLILTLRRSKTDQMGEGRKIGIPRDDNPDICPVVAFQEWLAEMAYPLAPERMTKVGPLFVRVDRHSRILLGERLSGDAIAILVKNAVERIGLDRTLYAGHSLRAGLATSAARAGVSERDIARQTGHRSMTVLRGYIRDGELFRDNAAAAVWQSKE